MNNSVSPEIQQQFDDHVFNCMTSFEYYCLNCIKIQDEHTQLVPLKLNAVQRMLEEIWHDIVNAGRLIRLYILKSRRQTVSTWSTAKIFWLVAGTGRKNQYATIIAHDPSTTSYLFEMQKRYYINLPPELTVSTKKNNAYMLHFQNNEGTGLDSIIQVGTADVKDFGSGQPSTFIIASELAKWPKQNTESLLVSLRQTLPNVKGTAEIIESTAKGVGGVFHKGFYDCRYVYEVFQDEHQKPYWKMTINLDADSLSAYSSIFIPWYISEKYRMPVSEDFIRTKEEEEWVKKYRVCDEQLMWYRWVLVNKCDKNPAIRAQEYPFNAAEAFMSSGASPFDLNRVYHFIGLCKDPIARYLILTPDGQFVANPDGPCQVWVEPERHIPYLISADVAEGLSKGDFSTASVWNHHTGEEACHYHAKPDPYTYAEILYAMGKRYNWAMIVVERNKDGNSVIQRLVEMEYPNIYIEMIPDPPYKPRRREGWVTSEKSRHLIVNNLVRCFWQDDPGIQCKDTYKEMATFIDNDGKPEAEAGAYDDRVLMTAIGKYVMATTDPIIVISHNYGKAKRDTRETAKSKAVAKQRWKGSI